MGGRVTGGGVDELEGMGKLDCRGPAWNDLAVDGLAGGGGL